VISAVLAEEATQPQGLLGRICAAVLFVALAIAFN
jgi:hypothetical protein